LVTIVRRGAGDGEAVNETVPTVDPEMVLVAERRQSDRECRIPRQLKGVQAVGLQTG
jgi:hypothetical protein